MIIHGNGALVAPDGVIVVDKPAGMTSHDVVARVRRAVKASMDVAAPRRRHGPKVGHTGTLDPSATGVLVICLGRATRLVPWLQASTKTYDARLQLGVETTTLDADGIVVGATDASGVDEAALCDTFKGFVGEIQQIPPMVSAVKVGGERLYAKARRGEVIARAPRTVSIHDIVLEDFVPGPRAEASFLVTCTAGTYIRTLAADVGQRLGVGGHLIALRRLASGRMTIDVALDLDTVEKLLADGRGGDAMLTMAQAVADYPVVTLSAEDAQALCHGRRIPATGHDGPVAACDAAGALLAMVEDRDDQAWALAVFADGPTVDPGGAAATGGAAGGPDNGSGDVAGG